MAKEILQYDRMVEAALRAVVRQALGEVAERGLPGNHHFYITFRTTYPGVQLADHLKARFPAEMTIVLQYQFYDLSVDDDSFGVTLTFNNVAERLIVPLNAITVFADPSVNFALPLHPPEAAEELGLAETAKPGSTEPEENKDKSGEVVSLDQFRRK